MRTWPRSKKDLDDIKRRGFIKTTIKGVIIGAIIGIIIGMLI